MQYHVCVHIYINQGGWGMLHNMIVHTHVNANIVGGVPYSLDQMPRLLFISSP